MAMSLILIALMDSDDGDVNAMRIDGLHSVPSIASMYTNHDRNSMGIGVIGMGV